jgi:hypothetical protein
LSLLLLLLLLVLQAALLPHEQVRLVQQDQHQVWVPTQG